MPKLTVEYEINPDGDCSKCVINNNVCIPFNHCLDWIEDWCFGVDFGKYTQIQVCKDFLAQEASKIYCDGCRFKQKEIK